MNANTPNGIVFAVATLAAEYVRLGGLTMNTDADIIGVRGAPPGCYYRHPMWSFGSTAPNAQPTLIRGLIQ